MFVLASGAIVTVDPDSDENAAASPESEKPIVQALGQPAAVHVESY